MVTLTYDSQMRIVAVSDAIGQVTTVVAQVLRTDFPVF
jgi:hypothetical protein